MAQFQEFEGHIFMEVNGREFEVSSLDVQKNTGRKAVKTMNRKLRIAGFARGIATFDLKLTVVIPVDGDIDWMGVENAKITRVSPDGAKRVSYINAFVTAVGERHSVDNEATRDLSLTAEDEVTE